MKTNPGSNPAPLLTTAYSNSVSPLLHTNPEKDIKVRRKMPGGRAYLRRSKFRE